MVEYDDVMNKHREVIYGERKKYSRPESAPNRYGDGGVASPSWWMCIWLEITPTIGTSTDC